MTHEYTCAACGETFDSARSEDAAMKEREQIFPDMKHLPDTDFAIVCEDCFNKIIAKAKAAGVYRPN